MPRRRPVTRNDVLAWLEANARDYDAIAEFRKQTGDAMRDAVRCTEMAALYRAAARDVRAMRALEEGLDDGSPSRRDEALEALRARGFVRINDPRLAAASGEP